MNLGNPQKPLTNILLEFLSKKYGSDLDLKNKELGEIGKSNITRLHQILTEYKLESPFGKDVYNVELRKVLLESLEHALTGRLGPDILFPNLRPTNHFIKDEAAYAEVLAYTHSTGVGQNIGFIETLIEEVYIGDGWDGVKIKTFPDLLPVMHHMCHSSGRCSLNYGRLLKLSEYDALKALVNTDPEFVDLFRSNSVGSFRSLELYEISKYDKELMDTELRMRAAEAGAKSQPDIYNTIVKNNTLKYISYLRVFYFVLF